MFYLLLEGSSLVPELSNLIQKDPDLASKCFGEIVDISALGWSAAGRGRSGTRRPTLAGRHWHYRGLVRLCWTCSQAWSNWIIGVIRLGGDVSVLGADGKKKKLNPQLDIRATCSFASILVVPAWSPATGKCSFQLFQRLVHENALQSRRLRPARKS